MPRDEIDRPELEEISLEIVYPDEDPDEEEDLEEETEE